MFFRETVLGPRWYMQKAAFSQGDPVKVCYNCFETHLKPHLAALNPRVEAHVKDYAKRVYGHGTEAAVWHDLPLPDSFQPVLTQADRFHDASDTSDSAADDSSFSSDSEASAETATRSVRHGTRGGGPWLNDDRLSKLLESAAAKATAAGLHIAQPSTSVPINTPEFEAFANAFGGAPRSDKLVPPGIACRFCTPLPSRVGAAIANSATSADAAGGPAAAAPVQGTCAAHGGFGFAPVDVSLEPLAPSVSGVWMAALLARKNTAASVTATRVLSSRD